jgi:hypothetical protein
MARRELPPELAALMTALDAVERDARALVDGLDDSLGGWREAPGRWSVAECLDHLATANRVYLAAIRGAAVRARASGRLRRGPALPGLVGRWFVKKMEPPVPGQKRMRAPSKIRPRESPPLAEAFPAFLASHDAVRAFVREAADLDLAGVRFVNPFVAGLRFSLATGLHVIEAHERRHLWQAWRVRRAQERAAA